MPLHPLPDGESFKGMSLLYMNDRGRFIEPGKDTTDFTDADEISSEQLPEHLKRSIVLRDGVTDVFVWVHGWRNDSARAKATARRLFNGIVEVQRARQDHYPNLSNFVPSFVAVHWPSMSSPLPSGYKRIRDRAKNMTDEGEAEFFLASLLGYLDVQNERTGGPGSKVLRAKGGFYVHCIGHSFGGRFLTAAIRAAANPESPRTLALLNQTTSGARKVLSADAESRFQFTIDSLLVFQMAAPRIAFGDELRRLVEEAPLRGRSVLTFSSNDKANCLWHLTTEYEEAIGCSGAAEPKKYIGQISLGDLDYKYTAEDFSAEIVNVDCSSAFTADSFLQVEGAHSDFWYEESIHLVLSLANFAHA
jgi:hypothetical protein